MTIAIDFRDQAGERYLHVSASLKDAAECDQFIRDLTIARGFIDGGGLTRGNLAHAETAPASPAKAPDSAPVVTLDPASDRPDEGQASTAMDALTAVGSRTAGPPSDREQIIRVMWPTNASLNKIAAAVGMSAPWVRQKAVHLGLPQREAQLKAKERDRLGTWRSDKRAAGRPTDFADAPRAPAAAADGEVLDSEPGAAATNLSEESRESGEPQMATPVEASPPAGLPTTANPVLDAPASALPETAATETAPTGKLLVTTNGILLREDGITHGGRSIDVTAMECRALSVILRASPAPVDTAFIVKRAWPNIRREDAEIDLANVCRGLRERLPAIGLELVGAKGVGVLVRCREAQAA